MEKLIMIKLNKIVPPTLEVYSPDNRLIGVVNEYEFLDIRVQIKEQQLKGYYYIFNGIRGYIDIKGELEIYPKGLYDTMTDYLFELI